MKPALVFILLVAALTGAATCARRPSGPGRVALVYSADIAGFIEPCGCSKLQRGGLQRAAWALGQARGQGAVLAVDGGDALYEQPELPPEPRRSQMLSRGQAVARILREGLRIDVGAVGDRDKAAPARTAAQQLDVGFGGGDQQVILERGGVTVALVGGGDKAVERVRAVRGKARVVGVLWHEFARAPQAAAALKEAGADFVLAAHADDLAGGAGKNVALTDGPLPIFALEGHGQSLLRLDISVPANAPPGLVLVPGDQQRREELERIDARIVAYQERIAADPVGPAADLLKDKLQELAARKAALANAPPVAPPEGRAALAFAFLPLPLTAPEDSDVEAMVEAHMAESAQFTLARMKDQPEVCPPVPGKPSFMGGANCAECHEEADAFWKKTKHAIALPTLVEAKRQFNLECISCHVTGWREPGGACRIDKVERVQNVQCEACHGPGSVHAEDGTGPIARDVPREWCMRCHDKHNSPEFDYARYRREIVGPGHGQPK